MADRRPFAKIDTGYIQNPKWFRVRRAMRNAMPNALPTALQAALRTAMQAHLTSILYSAQNQTDGVFPVDAIKMICMISSEEDEAAITALFEVGLWINHPGGMAEVRDYLEHQTSAKEINERSEAANKAAKARWGTNANRNAERNANRNAERNAEEKRREEKIGEEKIRDISIAEPASGPAVTEDFAAFWTAFPSERKRAKSDCQKLFTQAVKAGTPAETIIQAAERYRADPNREPQFTVNPKTWLREQRWESGPLPARTNPGRPIEDRFDGWERAAQLVNQPNQLRAIEGGTP